MPRIKMLVGLAGDTRQPGDILDLPASEAQSLVRSGMAELVRSAPIETPEAARMERTVKKAAPKRPVRK